MAASADSDDTHIRPAGLEALPAVLAQQVMSPSGDAARGHERRETQQPTMNGVERSAEILRGGDHEDDAFRQALEGTGFGATLSNTGLGATNTQHGDVFDTAGSAHDGFTATTIGGETRGHDPPLLPHAAAQTSLPPAHPPTGWPSPLPSPTVAEQPGDVASPNPGRTTSQSGTTAFRWFSRLGEFVQRHATMVSQGRPGIEATVVQETVWSPGRSRNTAGGDGQLFDRSQTRRLREMAAQAPLLYGQATAGAARSDSSGSYSREQLEAEVRKQVEQAMSSQRILVEENQRLRLQVERLSGEAVTGREVDRRRGALEIMDGSSRERGGFQSFAAGEPVGNPPGLSGHDRIQGVNQQMLSGDGVSGGNPPGLSGRASGQGGEGLEQLGVPEGNPAGLSEHDRGLRGGLVEERDGLGPRDNVSGGNPAGLSGGSTGQSGDFVYRDKLPGGNPSGLSGHDRGQGGRFSYMHAPGVSSVPQNMHAPGVPGTASWNPLGVRRASSSPPRDRQVNEDSGPRAEAKDSSANPIDALMQGMSQLQAAMALQMGMAANRPEVIRPGVTGSELPKLPEADEQAAINVGDWLHGLAGPMGDLTDGSSRWWTEVMTSLDAFYKDYVGASTVRKVQLKAEDYSTAELKDPKWMRLDKRAASMLLQAVPANLKNELMANRLSSTISILGRILTIYRPGSAAERQQVLRALEAPGTANNAGELVDILRRWMRWLKRAQDLGLQVPDASILLKGLDTAAKQQMEKNGEVVFRSNMLRYSLDLDAAPTLSSILRYHSHLLAEFEQLSFRGRSRTTGPGTPTVKNVTTSQDTGGTATPKASASPTTTSGGKPCKFYLSETGCQRASCRFVHDWQSVPREDRADKCKGCGGKGHLKKNCPMKAGSEARPEGKGSGQPRLKPVSQDKREDGAMPSNEGLTATTSSTGSDAGNQPSAGTTTGTSTTSSTTPQSSEDFLKSATQILKMMAEQSAASNAMPSMKMLRRAVAKMEARMALVDSGATHPLRRATDPEWERSNEVDVLIAGDGVAKMRQNDTGTLLTNPEATRTQTILPVGSLVAILGYELLWTKRKCALRAPDGREIPLRVSSGCPEVNEATALELIAKLEDEKVSQLKEKAKATRLAVLRVQHVECCEQWETSMKEFVEKGKFEDGFRALVSMPWLRNVPREDLVKILADLPTTETEAWELMKLLGYNRRLRKRMLQKDWIVKFYSGRKTQADKIFKPMDSNDSIVLDVDVFRNAQLDVLKDGKGVFLMMLWGAATGRIAGIMAGLPQQQSDEHLLRLMTIMEVAKEGRKAMSMHMDIPNDGVGMAIWASSEADEDSSAQAFQREWFKRWVIESGYQQLYFEQGGLGHPLRRPTSLITTLDVQELRGVRDERKDEEASGHRSVWAPMLMHTLVRGWKRWKLRPGWYPRMVKAMKAVDRRAWERHLANDHVPHRPDCLQCIHNSTGRPHRKCLHRDCYVMSADTLGHVRVPGPRGEKYALVFTFQYPKQRLCPEDDLAGEEDLVGWDLDGKEVEKEDDQQDRADLLPTEDDDLKDYEPSIPGDFEEEVAVEQTKVDLDEIDEMLGLRVARGPEAATKEDWWEFRESAGILIRHHELPRKNLFRPTAANGCPVHTARLEDTRITDVKYMGGGVETETSDWCGPKSGSRALDGRWTGESRFRISTAEVPEDEEVLQRDEQQWEKLIGDLTQPIEMETIYMVYPVRSKRGGDAMLAIQEAVLRLKLMGFPVARLHTDRGSEFASRGLRRWLLDHDIYHTRSEALIPQTNGAAERGVRWFKTRAKVLLAEAGVHVKYWTLAMQHAANRRIHDRLGITKPLLLPFGTKVMIRRKVFGNNKKYDLTDRWEEGKYLGMSDTIKGGAVVLRSTGILTETLNLRTGVVDPRALLQVDAEPGGDGVPIVDLPQPDHRVKGKQTPPMLAQLNAETVSLGQLDQKPVIAGWKMRSFVQQQEQKAKLYYDMGKFDLTSCAEVLEDTVINGQMKNKARGAQTSSMILGAYIHGGIKGITKAGKRRPHLTKYLNMVLRSRVVEDLGEDGSWTTLGIFRASDIPPHRDLRNQLRSWNYVMEIGGKPRGGLWVSSENKDDAVRGGVRREPLVRELPEGRKVEGTLVDIGGKAVAFNPKEFHAYLHEQPDRWMIAGFTPLGVPTLNATAASFLSRWGFPLEGTGVERVCVEEDEVECSSSNSDSSEEETERPENAIRVLRCAMEQEEDERHKALMDERLEWYSALLQERDRRGFRQIAKISPGEAGDYEVEGLLQELSGDLQVVHNVSLPEVRKHLEKWKPAILKEVEALISSGTVRRLTPEQTRELKSQGMMIMPGKAVFTVKPPNESNAGSQERYRRKCRVVACGNYLPSNKDNVFASGTSADGLRLAIAFGVLKGWSAGSTDIANAFTLAPLPEDKLLGMSPPAVVVAAGGAKVGETWAIQKVLYGVREAPRWWSCFRNHRLASARIPMNDKTLVLECLETEEKPLEGVVRRRRDY